MIINFSNVSPILINHSGHRIVHLNVIQSNSPFQFIPNLTAGVFLHSRFQSNTFDYRSGIDHDPTLHCLHSYSFTSNRRKSSSSSSSSADFPMTIVYHYDREPNTNPNRKRSRRYYKKTSYDNSQTKRIKFSNRKQYSIKFSIDLTGQNINYTIEYHQTIIFIPFYYDFYYLSWLQTYYSYLYYLQALSRECEEKFMTIYLFVFLQREKKTLS